MIDSNLASSSAAEKATKAGANEASYQFHAMDFLDYAYLQTGQEAKARAIVQSVPDVPGASKSDIIDRANVFAARNALELHDWKEAASLPVPQERPDFLDVTYWTRTIGAARLHDIAGARSSLQQLMDAIHARNEAARNQGSEPPSEPVDQLEAEAWFSYAEGISIDAVSKMRSAAEREEADHDDPVATAAPAREMLADLLFELKRPTEALAEYEAVLKNYPNRFDALYGSAKAAAALGNRTQAANYYKHLVAISVPAADRPELREAQKYLAAAQD